MDAEILSIGSELMAGSIANTNAAFLSERLMNLGYRVTRHTAVGDCMEDILSALRRIAERADVAIVTGGIGPTPDDLTRQAFARFSGCELVEDEAGAELLRSRFAAWKHTPSPSNFIQATIPAGSRAMINHNGTATGFSLKHDGCDFFCLPGVPSEMKKMFDDDVAPRLRGRTGRITQVRTLHVIGVGESTIGEHLREFMGEGKNPEVATQAHHGEITVRITGSGPDEEKVRADMAVIESAVHSRLGTAIFGENGQTLAGAVAALLEGRGLRVAIAESCTGGEIASRLADIPGISRHLIEGAVTYSNDAKIRRLNVPPELIEKHGAVSAEVAEAMALGMRDTSGADLALAVTGIAGPSGGTPSKPVGLVYIALANLQDVEVREARLLGSRVRIKDRTTKQALNMLRLHLIGCCQELRP